MNPRARALATAVLSITFGLSVAGERTAAADDKIGYGFDYDEIDDNALVSTVTTMFKGTVRRARRAIAIGPTAGGAFTTYLEAEESAGSVSFGLSLYTFKVPVLPDSKLVKDVLKKRIKAKLIEIVKRRALDGLPPLTKAARENLVLEIMQEVKAEFLGQANLRAKTFERPRFALTVEGDYNLNGGIISLRTRIGLGVSRLLIGPTLGLHFPDDTIFSLGGEMALLVLPGKGPRSPVFDLFLRGEFPVNTATDAYSLGLGLRLLVDII